MNDVLEYLEANHKISISDKFYEDRPRYAGKNYFAKVHSPKFSLKCKMIQCDLSFSEVVNARKSWRNLVSFDTRFILSILHQSLRVVDICGESTAGTLTFRPYSSSGGIHSIEVLCIVNNLSDLENGVWLYEPFKSELQYVGLKKYGDDVSTLATKLLNSTRIPPVTLILVSNLDRHQAKYSKGLSLIWRDAGNILSLLSYQTIAHGLSSCQLGVSERFIHGEVIGLKEKPLWVVGGISIGQCSS